MQMVASPAPLLILGCLITIIGGCSPATERPVPAERISEPTFRGLQPYAYSTPVPPLESTALDGSYRRTIAPDQGAGTPIACRRCAPYRLDAGTALLVLEQGRFFLLFRPAHSGPVCPSCKPPGSFRATGHFVLDGDRVELFNDPNCAEVRGSYRWEQEDGRLQLEAISDPCFGGIRGRFLAIRAWSVG